MRFTAQEAYEAWQDGDPIMVEPAAAEVICKRHDQTLADYLTEQHNGQPQDAIEAWSLLGWLGY